MRNQTLAWFQRWTKCLATSRHGGPHIAQWTSCHGIRGYFSRSSSSFIESSHEFGSDSLRMEKFSWKLKWICNFYNALCVVEMDKFSWPMFYDAHVDSRISILYWHIAIISTHQRLIIFFYASGKIYKDMHWNFISLFQLHMVFNFVTILLHECIMSTKFGKLIDTTNLMPRNPA